MSMPGGKVSMPGSQTVSMPGRSAAMPGRSAAVPGPRREQAQAPQYQPHPLAHVGAMPVPGDAEQRRQVANQPAIDEAKARQKERRPAIDEGNASEKPVPSDATKSRLECAITKQTSPARREARRSQARARIQPRWSTEPRRSESCGIARISM